MRDKKNAEKRYIQSKRVQVLRNRGGVSGGKTVDIDHVWKSKRISPLRFNSTHETLFVPKIKENNPLRENKLKLEDTHGRKFDIFNQIKTLEA